MQQIFDLHKTFLFVLGRRQRNPYVPFSYIFSCLHHRLFGLCGHEGRSFWIPSCYNQRNSLCLSPELDCCFPVPHMFLLLGLFHQFGRCLGVSISVIKHHNQMQLVEQRDYSAYISQVTLHQWGKSHRNSQREPRGRNWSRNHEENCLLSDSPKLSQPAFL